MLAPEEAGGRRLGQLPEILRPYGIAARRTRTHHGERLQVPGKKLFMENNNKNISYHRAEIQDLRQALAEAGHSHKGIIGCR